jgi:hypothetical protein
MKTPITTALISGTAALLAACGQQGKAPAAPKAEVAAPVESEELLLTLRGREATKVVDCLNKAVDSNAPLVPDDLMAQPGAPEVATADTFKPDLTLTREIAKQGDKAVKDEIVLYTSTSEGAHAAQTYGDKQFWYAMRVVFDPKGSVTRVDQLDESIGFDGYSRKSSYKARSGGMDTIDIPSREGIAACGAPLIAKAFKGLTQ